jgi:hypothetical protein
MSRGSRGLGLAISVGMPAGALSVVACHQGLLYFMNHVAHVTRAAAYSMVPLPPYDVPATIWLALCGAVYGAALVLLLRLIHLLPDFVTGIVIGAGLTFLAGPGGLPLLRDLPLFGLGTPQPIWLAMLLNAAWGFGTVFFTRPFALRG